MQDQYKGCIYNDIVNASNQHDIVMVKAVNKSFYLGDSAAIDMQIFCSLTSLKFIHKYDADV